MHIHTHCDTCMYIYIYMYRYIYLALNRDDPGIPQGVCISLCSANIHICGISLDPIMQIARCKPRYFWRQSGRAR